MAFEKTQQGILAGATGFEPVNHGVKVHCVTTSPHPNISERARLSHSLLLLWLFVMGLDKVREHTFSPQIQPQ